MRICSSKPKADRNQPRQKKKSTRRGTPSASASENSRARKQSGFAPGIPFAVQQIVN
jgi:hypothetical protein